MASKTALGVVAAFLTVIIFSGCGGGSSSRPATTIIDPDPVEGGPKLEETTIGPLISGTSSQIGGTYVWTDYAYDDRGTNPSVTPEENGNDADLIQLQLRPDTESLYIKAVLETLIDPAVPLLGIGLDLDGNPNTGGLSLPGGKWVVSGQSLGLERVITIAETGAEVWSWDGAGWQNTASLDSVVDTDENTLFAEIPNELLGAYGQVWHAVAAVGLSAPSWLNGDGPISDLAYVRDESTSNFQSNLQAAILSGEEDAQLAVATIDLNSLASGVDNIAQPIAGIKNTFLYRSALDLGEGIRVGDSQNPALTFAGPYQPYAVWFPRSLPAKPGLIMYLHGTYYSHMSGPYGGTEIGIEDIPRWVTNIDFGIEGGSVPGYSMGMLAPNAVMVTPLGRSTGGPTDGAAVQDYLDVTSDVISRLNIDEDRVVLTGYSVGGVSTFRLSQLYPDRWAGAVAIAGSPTTSIFEVQESIAGTQTYPNALENLYSLPFRFMNSRLDELTSTAATPYLDLAVLQLQQLGYDFRHWQILRREHFSIPVSLVQCELELAIARGRVRDPARVVFSYEPLLDRIDDTIGLKMVRNSAYWVSNIQVRGEAYGRGDKGTVDITSLAFANRQPETEPVYGLYENVSAGRDVCGPNPDANTLDTWYEIGNKRVAGVPLAVSNGMEGSLTKVESVHLDLLGMRLSTNNPIKITISTDGDSVLHLAGHWPGAVSIEPSTGESVITCPVDNMIDVALTSTSGDIWLRPANANCP